MKTGDIVQVTNLDGETAEGEIAAILATTVEEYQADFLDADGATLLDFWRGHDVQPDEPVVDVALSTGVYAYPISRVEVIE